MKNHKITDVMGRPWPYEDVLNCTEPGWRGIVAQLIADLFDLGWDGNLQQIKEKFGGLRFYIGGSTDEVWDRIGKAEAESLRTCQNCGAPGKQRGVGWVYTFCTPCWDRHCILTAPTQRAIDYTNRKELNASTCCKTKED